MLSAFAMSGAEPSEVRAPTGEQVAAFLRPKLTFANSNLLGGPRFIYIIQASGHTPCKIGVAASIPQRMAELQCGAWDKLRCRAALHVRSGNALKLEQATHRHLSDVRRIGEWFNVSPEAAVEAVLLVADRLGAVVQPVADAVAAKERALSEEVLLAEDERRRLLRVKLGID